MALFKTCLVLHVGANTLNWGKVAQISILGKSGGKGSLRTIEKFWVRQLVFWFLRPYKGSGGPCLHQLLTEVANLGNLLGDVLLIINLIYKVRIFGVFVVD